MVVASLIVDARAVGVGVSVRAVFVSVSLSVDFRRWVLFIVLPHSLLFGFTRF